MAHYQTAQKKKLREFMTLHSERAFSVEELCCEMEKVYKKEDIPGKSTVYRLIQQMESEGTVKRMLKEHSRRFAYQIAGGEHCASHIHMKCMDCGRILHMGDDETLKIMAEVLERNNFSVDEKETVLVGRCGDCKN